MTLQISSPVPRLDVDSAKLPALIDLDGINKHLAPVSRSLLYALAAAGEIQTASVGLKRGSRVWVTASVISWLNRRLATTKKPNLTSRRKTPGVPAPAVQP